MTLRLIHPATLTITPIDTGSARLDELAGQATVRETYGAAITLEAQIDPATEQSFRRIGFVGRVEESSYVATVRRKDAVAASYTPTAGDRITTITEKDGTVSTDELYVAEARRSAAWRSGWTTWLLRLVDRRPTKKA